MGLEEAASGLVAWLPDLLYAGGRFRRETALVCDDAGRIVSVARLPVELFRSGGGEMVTIPLIGNDAARARVVRLRRRALLPGLVNAHSHAFQRVIRGRTEYRSSHSEADSFWTWREMMYDAATRLRPEDLYDASRMAFLEMAASGITSVGEFHYLHRTPRGDAYEDPNLLAQAVVRAARDVGMRIALLRVAYARAGFQRPPDARQSRFIEADPDTYLRHVEHLRRELDAQERAANGDETTRHGGGAKTEPAKADNAAQNRGGAAEAAGSSIKFESEVAGDEAGLLRGAWVGVAPHSVRAVPLEHLRAVCAYAAEHRLPVHMHVAEQPAEISACLAEHGRTPVALLADEGLLSERFTGVHAVHITPEEARSLARAGAFVCACPTTERNLGDGIVPAELLFKEGVRIALGTDSHTQIDLLEDARELEYHLRLQKLSRNVLAPAHDKKAGVEDERTRDEDEHASGEDASEQVRGEDESEHASETARTSALAARLFSCATIDGARSVGLAGGELAPGGAADFFTVDLHDPSIAGASEEDLLPAIVFSLARTAVREVAVGGRLIIEDGRHAAGEEVIERFSALQRRLWGKAGA